MKNDKPKNIFANLFAAFSGVYLGRNRDLKISNSAQHTPQFCANCGKILDIEGDPSSICRGEICLECSLSDSET